jgi:hypothetical protein
VYTDIKPLQFKKAIDPPLTDDAEQQGLSRHAPHGRQQALDLRWGV